MEKFDPLQYDFGSFSTSLANFQDNQFAKLLFLLHYLINRSGKTVLVVKFWRFIKNYTILTGIVVKPWKYFERPPAWSRAWAYVPLRCLWKSGTFGLERLVQNVFFIGGGGGGAGFVS